MKNVYKVIAENRKRAIELMIHENRLSFDLSEMDGDEIPYVIATLGDGLIDCVIINIDYDKEKDIFLFKAMDLDNGNKIEIDEYDCSRGTENDVYMWIGEEFNDEVI